MLNYFDIHDLDKITVAELDTQDLEKMTTAERFYTMELMLVAIKNGHTLPLDVAFVLAKDVMLKQS